MGIKAMDLTKLDIQAASETAAVVQLYHPTDFTKLDGMTLSVIGFQSETYQAAKRAQDRKVAKMTDLQRQNYEDSGKKELDESLVLAAIVTEWTGFEENGKALKCTREEVARIFKKYGWISHQAVLAAADGSNFLKS